MPKKGAYPAKISFRTVEGYKAYYARKSAEEKQAREKLELKERRKQEHGEFKLKMCSTISQLFGVEKQSVNGEEPTNKVDGKRDKQI
jgi:peroxiredoxin family protein